MSGQRSPRRSLTAILTFLAMALAASALTANVAAAAGPTHSPQSNLGASVSLPECVSRCSLRQRLLDARLRRAETASVRPAGTTTRSAGRARPDEKEQSGFKGAVTDAKTKAQITGVEVCAYELLELEAGAYQREELEPACGEVIGGAYEIGVTPGRYVVEFFDPEGNYLTQLYNNVSGEEDPDLVTVKAEAVTTGINAALSEGGRIEGTVTAASGGAALAGFGVCAAEPAIEEFKCTETGSGGKYQIAGLPAGTYVLGFSVPEKPGDNYFDATLSGVKVKLFETTPGANAALASGGEIEGVVTTAEGGTPLAHAEVCAFLASGEEVEECAETAADGSYTIERLPTGIYQVEFEDFPGYVSQFYAGVPHLAQASTISVTAGASPVTNINGALFMHGGTIKGRVTSEVGDAPLGGAEVCAIAPPDHVITCTLSGSEGNYSLDKLPEGNYQIEFRDSPDYSTKFYAGKSTLAEATLVPVTLGGTVEGINALLELTGVHVEGAGSIEGRVTAQASGLPLGGAIVCANSTTSTCAETGSDGTYTIDGLPEGEYTVEFTDAPHYLAEFYNEASSLAEATLLDIAGETKATGIDAKLRPFVPAPSPSGGAVSSTTPRPSGGSGVLATKVVVPSVTAQAAVRVSGRRATVKLHCAVGSCHGTLALAITVTRRHKAHGHTVTRHVSLVVGTGTFALAQGANSTVTIHLTSRGRALLATAARHPRPGKLKLTLQGAAGGVRAVTIR